MKKLIVATILTLAALPAMAQYYGHRIHQHHHHHHRGGNLGPIIGGAILGAVIYDIYNRPIVMQPPPVIVHNPPVIVHTPPIVHQYPVQNCTPWTEVQNPDGTITRSRTCNQ
jgi:hypothetical protein